MARYQLPAAQGAASLSDRRLILSPAPVMTDAGNHAIRPIGCDRTRCAAAGLFYALPHVGDRRQQMSVR